MRIGIVGAGIAGLACARGLADGHDVVLFDKGRGPGGRMSTRRFQTAAGEAHFDHGAQYFTVHDDRFRVQLRSWIDAGVAQAWAAAGENAYVGVPAMNSPIRDLARHHVVHWSTLVTGLERRTGHWRLFLSGGDSYDADLVVIAIPAEQAAGLLVDTAPDIAARATAAISEPCWTAMAAFAGPVPVNGDCRRGENPDDDVIGWAARNSAKPGRGGPESWVVQATPGWSRRHIDADRDEVTETLVAALSGMLDVELPPVIGSAAHLWRFARCAPDGPGVILDRDRSLGVCGDWLIGPRVESAWLSGTALADRINDVGLG